MKRYALVLIGLTCLSFFALLNSVSAKPLEGDVTHDGKVDIYDVLRIANCYGAARHTSSWKTAVRFDVNHNGRIDIFDLILVTQNYGVHV